MKKQFNILQFISNFIKFSSRQGENEKKAAKLIISVLDKNKISYSVHEFSTKIPLSKKASLFANGKKINCKSCSFVSGKINDKEHLISSLTPSVCFLELPNINFNPKCLDISLSNHYFAPAIAIYRKDLQKIIKANKITGEVKVTPYKYQSQNILIGNQKNPEVIVFAHYDSIGKGATDNASGVAVLMKSIIDHPETLSKTLYVFSGNEELSYDKPTYWGHGYREFEKKYKNILEKSKKIIVVDGVGSGKTNIYRDKNMIHLTFPIKSVKKLENKIIVLLGDFEKIMTVYHSDSDNISQLNIKYLLEAEKLLIKKVSI
ncbi:MAG: M28 family peptidase [bacterium]|nr:M28 family peptidase [bacterium]